MKALEEEAKKAAKSPERSAAAPADDDDDEDEEEETDNPLRADRTQLRKLYEALDKAQDMKRKIAMGRVKKPSPPQLMLANQFDMLTKAVATEEARIEEEEKRLRREAGLPEVEEVELTPEEARLAEVEEEMKAAAEKMDFAEAARLKAIFDRLKAGLPEEEEVVVEPEPEVEEAPAVEAEPEAEPEAEAAPAEEEEKAEEKVVEPEPEVEEEPAPVEEEKVEEPEPEPEPEPVVVKKEKPKPLTPDHPDYAKGLTIVRNKASPKAGEAAAAGGGGGGGVSLDTYQLDLDTAPKVSFDELMSQAKKKQAVTEPFAVTYGKHEALPAARPKASSREGILVAQAKKRLMKDILDLQESPLYNVKADHEDLFSWHVNVSPTDGPYAGYVLHFVVYFPDSYPMEPPTVRCCSPISHPCVENTHRCAQEVCLHVNERSEPKKDNGYKGWCPAYSARTVLTHLASMFDRSYFGDRKAAAKRLPQDLLAVQNFVCRDTGHSQASPVPAVPCFNGPFTDMPKVLSVQGGMVWSGEAERCGHYWQHNYSGAGRHYFRSVLGYRGESEGWWALGWSTPEGDLVEPGHDEFTWVFEPSKGQIIHNGTVIETGVTAKPGDAVDCIVDLDAGVASFAVNGVALEQTFTGLDASVLYHPLFCLGAQSGVELVFVPDAAALPADSLPVATPPARDEEAKEEPLRCAVTKEGMEDNVVLGVGLRVTRKEHEVVALAADADLVSEEAFTKGNFRKGLREAHTLEAFLPLLLDAAHAERSLPLLEKAMAGVLRNPRASLPSYYKPPFKAANVNVVMPLLLTGVVDELLKQLGAGRAPKEHAIQHAMFLFSHIVHGYKALAAKHSAVADDANKRLAAPESLDPVGLCIGVLVPEAETLFTGLLKKTLSGADSLEKAFKERKQELKRLVAAETFRSMFVDSDEQDMSAAAGVPTVDQTDLLRRTCAALASAKTCLDVCVF